MIANNAATVANCEVRIWVERDEDASRISAVLEALGYTVLRELEEGDGPARLRWAVNRLCHRHKLTARERDVLERVLAGRNNEQIGKDLEISRATVKWHMHNIFAKTNTGNREALLRLALQLGGKQQVREGGEEDAPGEPQSEQPTQPIEVPAKPGPNFHPAMVREIIAAEDVPSKSWG
ncbi:probable response regulator transcription regulator protein [Plesiocystis pacifica SIR-1]|uniref:Probable response regulator transcription regulator protein n=1 Tax=Plesiocystis pacifica SIR-1 TaxID=391625 RepID=A6GGE7_9BACT|nr:helix-turn-helix transcriptional regulator [Plesiocystis pacifica]EDM75068.1 probable response regulator transcription regulator protein [Plesiocystis pacifica SIR-1]